VPPPSPPSAPRLPERFASRHAAAPQDHERWEELDLAGLSLAGHSARGVEIVRSRFTDADLGAAQLRGLRLSDCEVVTSNLANLVAIDGTLERCAFSACRLTGFSWPGTLEEVRFSDCRIDLAAFGHARFRRAVFEGCLLADADFRDARFDSVAFHRCDLTTATFSGARFERSEIRGCTLDGIRGVDGLHGAALDWEDVVGLAGSMAAALGIRVVEDD
jgi:uncharacterized protein YjbI with pentapeptide repeats